MQLIEGSNQIDNLLVFSYIFMIVSKSNDLSISLTIQNFVYSFNDCICLWIDMVVGLSWIGFDAIIVTRLFELTLELADTSIVKDNKLRSRIMCQPLTGVMKRILDGCC
jgi:hypothetical protein